MRCFKSGSKRTENQGFTLVRVRWESRERHGRHGIHIFGRYKTVGADAEGRFNISGIAPGEYKIFIFDDVPYYASANPDFISRYEASGVPLTIKGGETLAFAGPVIPLR